ANRVAGPLVMWATSVRLVDFAVGDLVQALGLPGCVAGTALRHRRGDTTDSGRGELSSYLFNEELLWPLMYGVRSALAEVPQQSAYGMWLLAAAAAVRGFGRRGPLFPAALAYALWVEMRSDIRRAYRSPHADVRAYGEALCRRAGPELWTSWTDYHARLE